MKVWIGVFALFIGCGSFGQGQVCPDNISFSKSNLTNWTVYVGNNKDGNGPTAIRKTYSPATAFPNGTQGAVSFPEWQLTAPNSVQINTTQGADMFGGFQTIPTINGYRYGYSVTIGSTKVSNLRSSTQGPEGGYIRGIKYLINVPAGSPTEPYTMTYAYAMVLENGSHNSNEQPLFSATLTTSDSVISCASPRYYLPTLGGVGEGERGALLDSAAAKNAGFKVSGRLSPNATPNGPGAGTAHLQDVWTKGWTEVSFDLSAYRGRQVTLAFESDNCIPGGHFAYAYVALRNNCAGLDISGEPIACTNANLTYSIPALTGAKYDWSVPSDWTIVSARDTSVIQVLVGVQPGRVIVHQQNSCADLRDTLLVRASPPTIAGEILGDTTVCAGININPLYITGKRGDIVKWLASSNGGADWTVIPTLSSTYTANNLSQTTLFRALVQNGTTCTIDTSLGAIVTVDQKSDAGDINPSQTNICKGQEPTAFLTLTNSVGAVLNWQSSADAVTWQDQNPSVQATTYTATNILTTTQFRTIVKNGVCIPDTSSPAKVELFDALFPEAHINPPDTTICYGGQAQLDANIVIGTSYTWNTTEALSNPGNGNIPSAPGFISASAAPLTTTDYVLTVSNENCPNLLSDTFHIKVLAPILVDAGRDTSVVVNQPLQLNVRSSEASATYSWAPSFGLNDPLVSNPVGIYDAGIDSVRYLVTATVGNCYGHADILVKVFKTGPDIFVPNAFTPGKASNPIFRPIPVGVASLQYFRIFNRWGQLVYSSSRPGDGWDGTLDGKPQGSGAYVWMVQGTSYTGQTIRKKGVMTLIR